MLKPHALRTTAREVASQLGPIETSLDESFSRTAGLLAYLPSARQSANLPMEVGHIALQKVLASLNSIAQARDEMIAAHREFADIRDELRIAEKDFGSLGGCPSPEASLQLIETRAA